MNTCQNCQTALPSSADFCPSCGARSATVAAGGMLTLGGLSTIGEAETGRRAIGDVELPPPGARFGDRYVIGEPVGMGGMGVVVRARDEVTGRDVALKLIRADRIGGEREVERIIAEGVTTREIRHGNVVSVYDVGVERGQPYITMELIDGKSLRAWLREASAEGVDIPVDIAKRIVQELCAGLTAAHAQGVVHRDLKPENVILLATPTAERAPLKILDFGIARAADAGSGTGSSSGVGTPHYMAPEQATQADLVKESADVYSLAVMLYELLVGVLPQGHWQPPSGGRSDVPRSIDGVVQKGLSNRPAARQQSAEEFSTDLDRAMKGGSPLAGLEDLRELLPSGGFAFTRPVKVAVGAACGLLLLAVLGAALSGDDDVEPTGPGRYVHANDDLDDYVDDHVDDDIDDDVARFGDAKLRPVHELSGDWTDGFGNVVDMRVMRSGRVRGSGYYPGTDVRYTVRGQIDGQSVELTISTAGLPDTYGTGWWDGGHRVEFMFRDAFGAWINESVYQTP